MLLRYKYLNWLEILPTNPSLITWPSISIIGVTKEFYPNNKLRLEIYVNDNKHVVYGKDGVKKFEIFFKYKKSNTRINPGIQCPTYSSNVWGQIGVGYSSPFGKWIAYRNSKKDYETRIFSLQETTPLIKSLVHFNI